MVKKEKKVARTEGAVSLSDLVKDPREARALLRAKKIEKPACGRWEWTGDEVEAIKKVLKPLLK